jgi:hypothetical protein
MEQSPGENPSYFFYMSTQNGKGDKPRPIKDLQKFIQNWDEINWSKRNLEPILDGNPPDSSPLSKSKEWKQLSEYFYNNHLKGNK